MFYCINLPLYLFFFYLSKNQEFTDIDSYENIDLLQNDNNFETIYQNSCIKFLTYQFFWKIIKFY